jgi:hypothetical protein
LKLADVDRSSRVSVFLRWPRNPRNPRKEKNVITFVFFGGFHDHNIRHHQIETVPEACPYSGGRTRRDSGMITAPAQCKGQP